MWEGGDAQERGLKRLFRFGHPTPKIWILLPAAVEPVPAVSFTTVPAETPGIHTLVTLTGTGKDMPFGSRPIRRLRRAVFSSNQRTASSLLKFETGNARAVLESLLFFVHFCCFSRLRTSPAWYSSPFGRVKRGKMGAPSWIDFCCMPGTYSLVRFSVLRACVLSFVTFSSRNSFSASWKWRLCRGILSNAWER